MGIISWEILWFSQTFGAFPLEYTDDTEKGLRLKFSSKLYYWSLISYTLVISTSMTATVRVVIHENLLPGKRHSSTFPLFLDSFALCLLAIAVFSSQTRKYNVFGEMCSILETIHKRLELKTKDPVTKRKVYFILFYTTIVLALTYIVRSHHVPDYWLYFLFHITYYTQVSLFLQFTFVCCSLNQQFIIINGKIREEGMKQQHRRTSGSNLSLL